MKSLPYLRSILTAGMGFALLLTFLSGCEDSKSPTYTACTSSSDCKFNRICMDGQCVYPGDGDMVTEQEEEAPEQDAEVDGESQDQRCQRFCGEANTCQMLGDGEPFGATFSACLTWCAARSLPESVVACVEAANCDETAFYACLGHSGDGDTEEADEAELSDIAEEDASIPLDQCPHKSTLAMGDSTSGTLNAQDNTYEDASGCAAGSFPGNDQVWLLSLGPFAKARVSVVGQGFDPALWLLADCEGACVKAVDTAGSVESLDLTVGPNGVQVLLVVDSADAAAAGDYLLGVSDLNQ